MEKENEENKVKDLADSLQKGEISPKEALKELEERKLTEKKAWSKTLDIIPWIVYFALCFPLNLIFSARLLTIRFPVTVIYISIALAVFAIILVVWTGYYHRKIGGLNQMETVLLFKKGPYSVMRHPEVLGFMTVPVLLPVILSAYIPFTFLSIVAIVMIIAYSYIGVVLEENRLDIPKWGDEYRQYMKEVPRFNFIKGLWNLRKRGKG